MCQSYDVLRLIFFLAAVQAKYEKSECVYRRKAVYTNWPPLVIICLTDHHLSPGHVSKSFNAVCARGGALERGGVLCARASECSRGGRDINPSYFLLRRTRTLDTHTHRHQATFHSYSERWMKVALQCTHIVILVCSFMRSCMGFFYLQLSHASQVQIVTKFANYY
jgi:hypothetical protein